MSNSEYYYLINYKITLQAPKYKNNALKYKTY